MFAVLIAAPRHMAKMAIAFLLLPLVTLFDLALFQNVDLVAPNLPDMPSLCAVWYRHKVCHYQAHIVLELPYPALVSSTLSSDMFALRCPVLT